MSAVGCRFVNGSGIIPSMAPRFAPSLVLVLVLVGSTLPVAGCRSEVADPGSAGGTGAAAGADATTGQGAGYGGEASWEVETGAGGCDSVLYEPPIVKSQHVAMCATLDYLSLPPTSGPHYPKWADFQVYTTPIPWGFLVHAMEHGAVVVAHRCADCDQAEMMRAWVATQPKDSQCFEPVANRFIVVPAPDLDVPVALAAWGAMLKADCFDPAMAQLFADRYYAGGPEDTCARGIDPSDPSEEVPADCGK